MTMASLNKVQIIGNLGRDPESRTTQSGSTIVTLSVATSEAWTSRTSGERREVTEWHRVVIFAEGLGDTAARYLRKGSKVYLEGSLRTRKWQDQSGPLHDRDRAHPVQRQARRPRQARHQQWRGNSGAID
jgi:single-strand DNA-binding protein